MYPSDQQINQLYKEEFEAAKQYAKKLTVVNLSENKQSDSSSSNNAPPDHAQQQQTQLLEELKLMVQTSLNKLDNQRVSLARGLIHIGDYKTALKIIEKMPQWYLASYQDNAIQMCKSINANAVDPIYRKCNTLLKNFKEKNLGQLGTKSSKRSIYEEEWGDGDTKLEDMFGLFVDSVLPVLSALGPGISHDPILFSKLIRICIGFMESKKFTESFSNGEIKEQTPPPSTQSGSAGNTETNPPASTAPTPAQILSSLTSNEVSFFNHIYTMLNDVLLPSLSMLSMNPCLAIELWNLLKLFPYEMR